MKSLFSNFCNKNHFYNFKSGWLSPLLCQIFFKESYVVSHIQNQLTFSIISTGISRSSSEFDTRFTIVQPFPRLVRLWRLFLQIIDNYFFKQGCSWPRDGRADNVCWWSVRRFRPRRIESKNSGNYTVLYLEHLWV